MLDPSNASTVEKLWSLASLAAMLLHGWLACQAALDWKTALDARPTGDRLESWREASAGYYAIGQLFLFLPQILHLVIGVTAMTLPPSLAEQEEGTSSTLQVLLIVAGWMSVVAALGFWMARRELQRLTTEDAAKHPQREIVIEEE